MLETIGKRPTSLRPSMGSMADAPLARGPPPPPNILAAAFVPDKHNDSDNEDPQEQEPLGTDLPHPDPPAWAELPVPEPPSLHPLSLPRLCIASANIQGAMSNEQKLLEFEQLAKDNTVNIVFIQEFQGAADPSTCLQGAFNSFVCSAPAPTTT
ncbi:hypothetical protein DL89DRAFT_256187 [Linderina pennispora]|uniref:Uncharacterized protein n=1 Tax=Linderina pennispora TaxID=61395 RepID=A0A1Y1WC65_9FUNG|nr:uncharacterized protein DL89DRAFT_256187 [Linderina pennispora]ORX71127.1 hypothetical protein DL89DRAFT_256187 [Linderina pennispora]